MNGLTNPNNKGSNNTIKENDENEQSLINNGIAGSRNNNQ